MKRVRLSAALACAAALLAALPAAPASVQVGSFGLAVGQPAAATPCADLLPGGQRLRGGRLREPAAHDRRRHHVERTAERHLLRGPGHRPRRGLRGGELSSRGARRRRRLHTRVAFTPVESSCKERVRGGLVKDRVAGFALTDGTILRTDNNGDTFAQKNPLPGTRAPGGSATRSSCALPHRPDRRRRDLGRQDLPHDRRRELVEPDERHHPRGALLFLPRRERRLAVGDGFSSSSRGRPGRGRTSASRRRTCARSRGVR